MHFSPYLYHTLYIAYIIEKSLYFSDPVQGLETGMLHTDWFIWNVYFC